MRAAALVAIALLAACDPGYTIRGKVHAKDGAPIPNANVTTMCPDGRDPPWAISDAKGTFDQGGIGGFGGDCELAIKAYGYDTAHVPVKSVCTKESRVGCYEVLLDVTMTPAK